MFGLIKSFQSSGLTMKAFCARQNLAYSTFQYWHKKFKSEQYLSGPAFTEVKVEGSPSRKIVVRYSSGTEVHIPV